MSEEAYKCKSYRNYAVIWCYKTLGRWAIGPDKSSKFCWSYSEVTNKTPQSAITWSKIKDAFWYSNKTQFDGRYEMIKDNVYKNVKCEAFAYRYNDRWVIGPVLNSENPWIYRSGIDRESLSANFSD